MHSTNTKILFAALFFFLQSISAQTLIPYLGANGKYGYADESGKITITPKYDYLQILPPGRDAWATEVDKQRVLLLRNGMQFPGQGQLVNVLNFDSDVMGAPDTLNDLWLVNLSEKMVLINRKTGVSREYMHSRGIRNPNWFPVMYSSDDHHSAGVFHNGFFRVFHGKEQVNFVDKDLKEVFPCDYAAGMATPNGYFLLGNEHKKMGVGDRKGKILIPFEWIKLEPAYRDGYFIANSPNVPWGASPPKRAGVLDSKGKIMIDTVHHFIRSAGKDYFIVASKTRWGVMDYKGKWVLPQEFLEIRYAFDDLFLVKQADYKWNVYNAKGEKQLPDDVAEITPYRKNLYQKPFLAIQNRPLFGLVDSAMHLLYIDTLTKMVPMTLKSHPDKMHFIITKGATRGKAEQQGILDHTGRVVLPVIYDDIRMLDYGKEDLYLLSEGGVFGVSDTDGKVVFPLQYSSIKVENGFNGSDTIIWAKPLGSKLYSAYDKNGQKMDYPDYFMATSNQGTILESAYYRNEGTKVTTMDGNSFPVSNITAYQRLMQFRTADGGFLVGKSSQFFRVMDAFLKDILPKDFVVPVDLLNNDNLKNTGLLAVFQLPADFVSGQTIPVEKKAQPPVQNGDIAIEVAQGPMSDAYSDAFRINYATGTGTGKGPGTANEKFVMPSQYEACGVINAKGEWVIEPQKGVRFIPMSYHWVQEISGTGSEEIIRLHRINHPEAKVIAVSSVTYPFFNEKNGFNMRIGQKTRGKNAQRFAYFNADGEQLTDFNILRGERHLKSRNLATMLAKKGNPVDVIFDDKGQVLVELDGLEADATYADSTDWNVRYLVAKKRGGELYGLIDSTGKTVLPFQYNHLKILEPGRLLLCDNAAGKTDVLNWQGEMIYSAPGKSLFTMLKPENDYRLLSTEDLTLVIKPDGTLLRTLPGKPKALSIFSHYPNYVSFIDPASEKEYWIDYVSGISFRE